MKVNKRAAGTVHQSPITEGKHAKTNVKNFKRSNLILVHENSLAMYTDTESGHVERECL
jgi:hypothetical protein